MARVYNFSAGPSCLPEEVLNACAAEMLDYNGTGQSVMEMSHRSKAYEPIIQDAEAMVRKLMNVPDNYKVLFVQGGGSTQFAMVAENLGIHTGKAAYIETGVWAKKAAAEAKKLGVDVDKMATKAEDGLEGVQQALLDRLAEFSYGNKNFNKHFFSFDFLTDVFDKEEWQDFDTVLNQINWGAFLKYTK
jgi:phosphoserine aminotransferase